MTYERRRSTCWQSATLCQQHTSSVGDGVSLSPRFGGAWLCHRNEPSFNQWKQMTGVSTVVAVDADAVEYLCPAQCLLRDSDQDLCPCSPSASTSS